MIRRTYAMKVILTQDVKSQGKKGDLINVSDGYANNFLLKKGLAKVATKQAINELESKKGAEQYRKNQEELKAQNIADRMKDFTVKLTAKAGKEGKLFGSITSKDVAQALKDQYNITVDKRKIDLPDGIKSCGIRDVNVTLYHDGQKQASGKSSEVLGNPFKSLSWLVGKLAEQGKGFRTGQLVSSGTFLLPPHLTKGVWTAKFDHGFGDVTVNVND